jgi:hypothetical protein
MPVARSGLFWRRIFVLLLLAAGGVYVASARGGFPHGGSPLGLTYGVTGFALMLLLAFFGIRKRSYRSTFGTLEQWLQSHIWLGVFAFVILLLHTGFRFEDRVAVTSFVLLAIVVGSGIFGAVLYRNIPRQLTDVQSGLPAEKMSEQLNQLARSMARLASARSAPFQRLFSELMRESQPPPLAGWRLLAAPMRRAAAAAGEWSDLVALVPAEEHEELRQMLVVARQRRELLARLEAQQRYKNLLEAWLWIHVPFTFALLLFSLVHIGAVFYFGTVQW